MSGSLTAVFRELARCRFCRNWRANSQDRGYWRHLLAEAKPHPGL